MTKPTVLIGMSGGVDSSVAAWALLEQGFAVTGCTMLLHEGPDGQQDARAVASRLGLPFVVLDRRETFRQEVLADFVRCYEAGLTPNPCIRCNQALKFGAMLDEAPALGCEKIATGHYARIRFEERSGRYLLYKARDENKDQTYFLAGLSQHQLSRTLFPLGELTKEQVRTIAENQGFGNARKKDSQDICFIPDGDYLPFLEGWRGGPYPQGDYLTADGRAVGRHKGAVAYTIGQRKGLGIALGAPAYVIAKDMQANTVTVGPNDALFSRGLIARDWNWLPFPALAEPMAVTAKIRHSRSEATATVYPLADDRAEVRFEEPQRAITPGQAVVLYDGDMVVGGGTIEAAIP